MHHPEHELQIDALLDGELAAAEADVLSRHLEVCHACAEQRDERLALRRAIQGALPPLVPPDTLAARVRRGIREARQAEQRRQRMPRWQWAAVAATLVVVGFGGWQLGRRSAQPSLSDEVLQSHVRSLMPGHLTDVLSSDQHTVKPWFNGVLDYSPPVYDFAGAGFPLVGGRLDYIGGRKVAALVYARRKHLINVMVWPRTGENNEGQRGFRQGYNILHWTTPAYVYWVTSDLGRPELNQFIGLLQQSDSLTGVARE